VSGRGLFIVGTDTGVGKTTFSVGLCGALAARGLRVAAMKPCETGGGDDAARLIAATGRALDPALCNPYRFALPAAPEVAARADGTRIEVARIEDAYRALAADADWTIVEGAGGLLVPLDETHSFADLIARLALPVIVVARTRLGTINHTLLTVEALRRRGLTLAGVVFSRAQRSVGPEEGETVETIVRHGQLRALGLLPFLSPTARKSLPRLCDAVRQHVDLDQLIASS
jgi:dethiobiotin synthetase